MKSWGHFVLFLGSLLYVHSIQAQKPPTPTVNKTVSQTELNIDKLFIEASREKILGNRPDAIMLFQEVLKEDKNNDAAMYELARLFVYEKQHKKALEYMTKAYKIDPSNFYYGILYCDLLDKQGKVVEATIVYEELIKRYPAKQDLYYELAYLLIKSNKPEEALKVYNSLESKYGIQEDISLRKHKVYIFMKKENKAIAELEALIGTAPYNTNYYMHLADYYESINKKEESKKIYEKILTIDPNNAKAKIAFSQQMKNQNGDETSYLKSLIGVVENPNSSLNDKINALNPYRENIKKMKPAEKEILLDLGEKLAETHHGETSALNLYGDLLYNSNQPEKALKVYEESLTIEENAPNIWRYTLAICDELQDYPKLLKGSKTFIAIFPNQIMGYYYYGRAANGLYNYKEAIPQLEQAVTIGNGVPKLQADLYSELGISYFNLQDYKKADESFSKALSLNADSPKAQSQYAYFLAMRGNDMAKAEQLAEKAFKNDENNWDVGNYYAFVLYKKQKLTEAKSILDKIMANGADKKASVLEQYGDILFKMNTIPEAINYWQRALQKNTNNTNLEKKIADKKLYE